MINERLKYLRVNIFNKTQKQMAEEFGIKEPAYNAIERGRRPFQETYIKILVYKYGVNEQWLKSGIGEAFQSSPKVAELMEHFEKYNPIERQYFINLTERQIDKEVRE